MVRSTSITNLPTHRWQRISHTMSEDAPLAPTLPANVLPQEMLHDDEVVLILTKPSLFFVLITSFRFILTALLLGILAVKTIQPHVSLSVQMFAALTALVCVARLVWALLVWSSHTYMLTNQRIVTIKGVLNTAMTQAHLRKVQRTVLYKPLYQRILGIGTIGIATAATEGFDATWVMIARPLQTHEAIVAEIQKHQ
jgi:uncharacterized membrane protein YdbT with pleckstrin-like domain